MCRKLAHTPLSPTDILHSSIRRSMSIFEGWWPEVTPHFQSTTSTNMIFKILQHEIILIWHGDMMKLLGLMRKTLIDYYFLFKPFDKKNYSMSENKVFVSSFNHIPHMSFWHHPMRVGGAVGTDQSQARKDSSTRLTVFQLFSQQFHAFFWEMSHSNATKDRVRDWRVLPSPNKNSNVLKDSFCPRPPILVPLS